MGLELNYENGQTPLNDDEKRGLRIHSITTKSELDQFEQLNIEKAIKWTLRKKLNAEDILTEKFVKNIHKRMFDDVWQWAGEFRKSEKNLGILWTEIGVELKKLHGDTFFWITNNTFTDEEIAIRYKHRLVSIHCFPNGNGRHSRLMADIMMGSIFGKEIFTWHQSSLVQSNQVRKKYIDALKEADLGNVQNLIEFATN